MDGNVYSMIGPHPGQLGWLRQTELIGSLWVVASIVSLVIVLHYFYQTIPSTEHRTCSLIEQSFAYIEKPPERLSLRRLRSETEQEQKGFEEWTVRPNTAQTPTTRGSMFLTHQPVSTDS